MTELLGDDSTRFSASEELNTRNYFEDVAFLPRIVQFEKIHKNLRKFSSRFFFLPLKEDTYSCHKL